MSGGFLPKRTEESKTIPMFFLLFCTRNNLHTWLTMTTRRREGNVQNLKKVERTYRTRIIGKLQQTTHQLYYSVHTVMCQNYLLVAIAVNHQKTSNDLELCDTTKKNTQGDKEFPTTCTLKYYHTHFLLFSIGFWFSLKTWFLKLGVVFKTRLRSWVNIQVWILIQDSSLYKLQ